MSKENQNIASEPMAATLSDAVCRSGLLGQVMKLSREDKVALMAYIKKDIEMDEAYETDDFDRIVLSKQMKEAVVKAESSFERGECLTEEGFRHRFQKWL